MTTSTPGTSGTPPTVADVPEGTQVDLVVADMDGTLLDGEGRVPEEFWPLLEAMKDKGVAFAPASGRQAATLSRLFEPSLQGMYLIAENGSYVVRDGEEISSATLDPHVVAQLVEATRSPQAAERNLGVVVCGKRSAYVERSDPEFVEECRKYYAALSVQEDVLTVVGAGNPGSEEGGEHDDILKVAVFDFDSAAEIEFLFERFEEDQQVVVSGPNWIDIMATGVDKGAAVRALQAEVGATRASTVAFGDYFNDSAMLAEADLSFAMGNAHPGVIEEANYLAPPNTEAGVITVLKALLNP